MCWIYSTIKLNQNIYKKLNLIDSFIENSKLRIYALCMNCQTTADNS